MSLLSRFALQGATGAPGQTYWYAEFNNTQDINPVFNENPIVYVQPGTGDIAVGLASGNDKAILAKIDTDANVLWSRFFTNAGAPHYPRIEKVVSTYIDDSGNSYFFGEGNDSVYSSREAQMVIIDPSNNVTLNVMPCDNASYSSPEFVAAVPSGSNFATKQGTGAIYTLINSSGIVQDRHDNPTITGTPDGTIQQALQNRHDVMLVGDDSLLWFYGYYSNFASLFTFNKSNFTRANGYYIKYGSNTIRGRSIAINSDGSKQAFTYTQPIAPNYYDMISFGSLAGGHTGYRNGVNYGAFRNNFAAFDDDDNVYWCFVGPYSNPYTTNYLVKFDITTGNILFQRELTVDGTNAGAQVTAMTIENDAIHLIFGQGSSSYRSSMIKLPLNGSGTGTYGNTIPITYQSTTLSSLTSWTPTINGPYQFSTTEPSLQNLTLDTSAMIQTTNIYSRSRFDEILESSGGAQGYWITDYLQDTGLQTQAHSIAVDSGDFVYVGNRNVSTGSYGGSIAKVNPLNGSVAYSGQIGTSSDPLIPTGIDVDGSTGQLWVSGFIDGGSGNNEKQVFITLDSSFNVLDISTDNSTSTSQSRRTFDLHFDGADYFAAGYMFGSGVDVAYVISADIVSSTDVSWNYSRGTNVAENTSFLGVTAEGQGTNQWYVGTRYNSSTTDYEGFIIKTPGTTSTSLSNVYTISAGTRVAFRSAVYAGSSIYVGGTYRANGTNTGRMFVMKLNTSGTPQWTRTFDYAAQENNVSGGSYYYSADIAVDSNENIYLYGSTYNVDGVVLVKMDSSGNKLWSNLLQHDNTFTDYTQAGRITVDSNDIPVVCGTTGGAFTTTETFNSAFAAKLPNDGSGTGTYGKWTYSSLSESLLTTNFTSSSFSSSYGTRAGDINSPTFTPAENVVIPPQQRQTVS